MNEKETEHVEAIYNLVAKSRSWQIRERITRRCPMCDKRHAGKDDVCQECHDRASDWPKAGIPDTMRSETVWSTRGSATFRSSLEL